jgi:hypothetical protein
MLAVSWNCVPLGAAWPPSEPVANRRSFLGLSRQKDPLTQDPTTASGVHGEVRRPLRQSGGPRARCPPRSPVTVF